MSINQNKGDETLHDVLQELHDFTIGTTMKRWLACLIGLTMEVNNNSTCSSLLLDVRLLLHVSNSCVMKLSITRILLDLNPYKLLGHGSMSIQFDKMTFNSQFLGIR